MSFGANVARLPLRGSAVTVLRRTVQFSVLALLLTVPAVSRYNNYLEARELDRYIERWDGTLQGEWLAGIDGVVRSVPGVEQERAGTVQRDRDSAREVSRHLRGSAWSMELGPLSMTDPLGAVESAVAARRVPWVLVVGVALPLLLTLVLGRVFCSWICPMGLLFELTDKLRGLLSFLELKPRNLRFRRSIKYSLLAVGLLVTAITSTQVLGYIYPPAVLGRELHDLVFVLFDRAESGRFGFSLAGLTWMSAVLGAVVAFEVLISRRWWCRYVCPGGALYSLIGAVRPLRVRLDPVACTSCADCVKACPMGLNPMHDQMGAECDSCGVCVAVCGDDALAYSVGMPPRISMETGDPS